MLKNMNIQEIFEKYNKATFYHIDKNQVKTLWTFKSNGDVLCTSNNKTNVYNINNEKVPTEIKRKLEIKILLSKMNNAQSNSNNEDAFKAGIDKINKLNDTNESNIVTSRDPRLKLILNRKKQDEQKNQTKDIENFLEKEETLRKKKDKEEKEETLRKKKDKEDKEETLRKKKDKEEKLRKEALSSLAENKKRELEDGEVINLNIKKQKNNYNEENNNHNRNNSYDKRNDNYDGRNNNDERNNYYYNMRNNNYDIRNNNNYDGRNNNDERNNYYYNMRNNNYDRRNDNYDMRNDNYDRRNMFDINVDSEMKLKHKDYSKYFGGDFKICDLFQSCKYCEKMNNDNFKYHKFEHCHQICTDKRCIDKRLHKIFECPFRSKYNGFDVNVNAIKYNIPTFMFKKFKHQSKFK